MKRAIVAMLSLVILLTTAGCGATAEEKTNYADTGEIQTISTSDSSEAKSISIPGTWQTASIGYMDGDDMQPEYYVEFTATEINYGHMKDGVFALDHSDKISLLEQTSSGGYKVQAESANGVQYTFQTAETDPNVLEFYETWNESEFSEMYRAGASLWK